MRSLLFDLGDTHVSAAIGTGKGSSLESVATVPCAGLKKGVVAQSAAVVEAIRSAVSSLDADTEGLPVCVTLSGAHVEVMPTQGLKLISPKNRAITHHDVMEVVNHSRSIVLPADREQIHIVPRGFRVDGRAGVTEPVGSPFFQMDWWQCIPEPLSP